MSFLSSFIWTLSILFFFYEFFLSVVLGTIAPEFIDSLNLTAEQFSLIGSAYFIIYGLMQTPVGILVDRFGVRFILTIACTCCSFGVLMLSMSDGIATALIARSITGFGAAFAFISILVITLNWFPRNNFAFLTGMAYLLGMIGPFLGGAPLVFLMDYFDNDWRHLFRIFSYTGFALALLIALFIRNKPKHQKQQIIFLDHKKNILSYVTLLLKSKQIWMIMVYAGLVYAPMILLGAFWGTTYLEAREFEKSSASFIISMLWLGLAIFAPIFGKISEMMHRRKVIIVPFPFIGIIISSVILYLQPENTYLMIALFFLLGICCAAQAITFTLVAENVSDKMHSTAMGLNNTIIILISVLIPNISTYLMGSINADVSYQVTDFTLALSVIPIAFLAAFIIATFGVKETYCRSQEAVHILNPN